MRDPDWIGQSKEDYEGGYEEMDKCPECNEGELELIIERCLESLVCNSCGYVVEE